MSLHWLLHRIEIMFRFFKKPDIVIKVTVFIEQDNGVFYAHSPTMPGLHVEGETEQEVEKHVEDAVVAYLISLIKHNDPLPIAEVVSEIPHARSYTFTQHLPTYA